MLTTIRTFENYMTDVSTSYTRMWSQDKTTIQFLSLMAETYIHVPVVVRFTSTSERLCGDLHKLAVLRES